MTRDDVIRMAREADKEGDLLWLDQRIDGYKEEVEFIERFANLVAAAEREACATLLDEMAAKDKLSNYYKVAALRIRERGAP
jgi:hypothetical protein